MHDLAPRRVLLATLACVVAAACWAANAVIATGAFERGVTPERLAETRVVVALVPLLGYVALARRDLLLPPRTTAPWLLLFGANMAAVNLAYYVAIDRVPVGVAISLQYTAPVLILAAVAIVSRRAPPALVWVAAACTLVGAALVSGAVTGGTGSALDPIGVAAGFASAVTFAGYLVAAEAAGARGSHPATTLLYGFVVAALIWALVLPLWSWPFHLLADAEVLWRVLAVGLLGTLLPFALTVWALRILSSAVAGIATTAEPVLAALLAWLLLAQALTVPQLAGGALVVAGVLVAQVARASRAASAPVEVTP